MERRTETTENKVKIKKIKKIKFHFNIRHAHSFFMCPKPNTMLGMEMTHSTEPLKGKKNTRWDKIFVNDSQDLLLTKSYIGGLYSWINALFSYFHRVGSMQSVLDLSQIHQVYWPHQRWRCATNGFPRCCFWHCAFKPSHMPISRYHLCLPLRTSRLGNSSRWPLPPPMRARTCCFFPSGLLPRLQT